MAQTGPLQEPLQEILGVTLENRLRLVNQQELRVEDIRPPQSRGNATPYWLVDFTRLRFEHGPGRANRHDPIQGFDLAGDEGFGEETAALYDPGTGYMLIQYNHFGVRAGAIQEYFSVFSGALARSYEFRVKMDESSEIRLAQKHILKKIHFKVAAAKMTAQQRQAGVSLSRAIDLSDALHGETIEVTITSARGQGGALQFNGLQSMIDTLRNLVFQGALSGTPVVEKFEVVGKNTPADRAEAIDMLTPKVEQVVDGVVIGADRRYTRDSRWHALVRARNGWATLLTP